MCVTHVKSQFFTIVCEIARTGIKNKTASLPQH